MKIKTLLIFALAVCAAQAQAEIRAEQKQGPIIRYYDSATQETLGVIAPTLLADHFIYQPTTTFLLTDTTDSLTPWYFSAVNSGSATIAAQSGGILTIGTGGANDDDAEFSGPLVFDSASVCGIEARVRVIGDVGETTGFNFGFSDARTEAADTLAVTYSGTTLTSTASDCALFFADSDATANYIRCVAVKNNTDGTVTSSGTLFAKDTWYILRVEIDADGDCSFWLNGAHVYTQATGITTTDALCPYFGIITRSGAAEALEVEYVYAWQGR